MIENAAVVLIIIASLIAIAILNSHLESISKHKKFLEDLEKRNKLIKENEELREKANNSSLMSAGYYYNKIDENNRVITKLLE